MTKEREKGFLSEEEWRTIIYYIYNEEDASFLENKILEFIKQKIDNIDMKQVNNKKLSREELAKLYTIKDDSKINFKDFSKIVMDYQIKLRDRYLKNFVIIFKKIDMDNDGIINEEEFFQIVNNLSYYGNEAEVQTERLLNISDPFNHQQITFSDCISLMSNEIIIDQDEKGNEISTSLLDKISSDENVLMNFNQQ
jgi:Ca2+-binding EF-hand superfamily protein